MIRANETALDELSDGEHAKLLEVFRVLRAARARMDDTVAVEHPEHGTCSSTVSRLQTEVEQLLAAQVDLRVRLRDSEDELEAARRLNRTLMRERNTATGAGG